MDLPEPGPRGGGEIASNLRVRLYRYRSVVKRYWWVLLLTVSIGLAYEAWVVFTKPTRYISVGKLSIRETNTDERSMARTMDPSWYGTVTGTIEGPAVRDRAQKLVGVNKPGQESKAKDVKIGAKNVPNTYFFEVTGIGPEPEFTTYFVDRTMEAFMDSRRDESRSMMQHQSQELRQQAELESRRMDEAKKAMQDFVIKENVPFIEAKVQEITGNQADLRKECDALKAELTTIEATDEATMLDGVGGGTGGNNRRPENDNGPARSDSWIEKQQELAVKEAELKMRAEVWKPTHPYYRDLVDEIGKLKVSIDVLKERAQKGKAAGLARLKAEIAAKEKQIAEYDEQAKKFKAIEGQYKLLQNEFDRWQKNYDASRVNLDKLVSDSAATEILAIQQTASPATEEPRGVTKGLITGILGGLVLGLGILFLMDRSDDRLASSSEMIEQFNEPILGQIPDVAESRTSEGLPLLQDEDQRYMYAESLRSLRSSLIFMPNQKELKTLIITSAIPNEGKSTIASNLAITMANAGARVLLVDADLRRGDIAALFDTDGRQGLANILRGEVEWKHCVKTFKGDKLNIIPRGPVTNQSGELLLQPGLPKLLAEWKNTFDLVIFNTAPILATDDTPTLAPNFDGTLMVVRASFTSARLTRNALNALYQRQVNVLGLILNCVDTEMPDYYYYRYPKYYAA